MAKLSLFADDMILHIETPKESVYKETVRANKWIQQSCRIQKSAVLLYTRNEQSEN